MSAPEIPEWLRPSMLPKLALCGQYRPGEVGDAAHRGTKLDGVFRALIARENVDVSALDADEREAVKWAEETASALGGDMKLASDEASLKAKADGVREGTADVACFPLCWSGDLKTGQKRNYREQMACYAAGFMEQTFSEEWVTYLFYCDLREVETIRWTYEEAKAVVLNAAARAKGEHPPQLNEYCGWCAKRLTCELRRESLGFPPDESRPVEEWESSLLRDFALRAKVIGEFDEAARAELLKRCLAGEKIPGVAMTSKKGSEVIPAEALTMLDRDQLVKLLGKVSLSKAKQFACGQPLPLEQVQQMPGSSFVTVRRVKEDAAA